MVTQVEYSAGIHPQPVSTNKVSTYTFDHLPLQYGGQLGPVTLAYETWGTLNAERDNAVLITHALTGSSHAHDVERPDDVKAAWWNPLIGPGALSTPRAISSSARTSWAVATAAPALHRRIRALGSHTACASPS